LQDVKWLPKVGEAAYVVGVEPRGVIFALNGGLAQQSEAAA
jgi:hypothetical protein